MRLRISILVITLLILNSTSAAATFNGEEDFSESRIVAASSNPSIGATGWVNYSGFLYDSRIVFTAGHLQDHDPNGTYYVLGPDKEISTSQSAVKVSKILFPTSYKTKIYANDFAIMILEKPLAEVSKAQLITPDLLAKAISAKSPMKITGFGAYQDVCALTKQISPCRFGSEYTSRVPRSIEMTPWNSAEIQNKFHQSDPDIADHVFFTGPYKSGPCGGDSGGPTTAVVDGAKYYVGTVPSGFWNAYACGQSPGYEGETLGWTAPVYKFLDLISQAEKYVAEHPYVEPSPTPTLYVSPAAGSTQPRTDYRYITELARNWAKASSPSETGRKQCTSARDSGFIYKKGKKSSLGLTSPLIRRDLKTKGGFQACLNGFK